MKPENVSAARVGSPWATTSLTYRANQLPSGDWQNRVSDARWRWNSVSGSSMFVTRNDSSYNIRVHRGWIDGNGGTLGTTHRSVSGGNTTSATIKIDQYEQWYTGTGTPPSTQFDLYSVMVHEFGHALAIRHTDQSCGSGWGPTMCPTTGQGDTFMRDLEYDDKLGLRYLYP